MLGLLIFCEIVAGITAAVKKNDVSHEDVQDYPLIQENIPCDFNTLFELLLLPHLNKPSSHFSQPQLMCIP